MKAIICTKYGTPDVLAIREIAKPVPKDNDILIKIYATTVTIGDVRIRSATFPTGLGLIMRIAFGFNKPKKYILGEEFAGEVEAIGNNVKQFKVGDLVFGDTNPSLGAYAEYMCLPENAKVAIKPTNLTFEEASAGPSATLSALNYLKKAEIQTRKKVLVYGASGALGTAAVQLAKCFGAEVTAVCGTSSQELMESLGADKVIDYKKEDFTQTNETYDLIFDAVSKSSYSSCKKILNQNGIYLPSVPTLTLIPQMIWTSIIRKKKVAIVIPKNTSDDLVYIKELMETGKIKPVIDRSYPLEQIAEAHAYVETGRKKGNVVITVGT